MICLSTFSKDFSSETTGPISIKFHVQLSGKDGKKVYTFSSGHMTMITPCPYIEKPLKKSSLPEPQGLLP